MVFLSSGNSMKQQRSASNKLGPASGQADVGGQLGGPEMFEDAALMGNDFMKTQLAAGSGDGGEAAGEVGGAELSLIHI